MNDAVPRFDVFVSAAFSALQHPVAPESKFRQVIERVLAAVERRGFVPYSSHRREAWGKSIDTPRGACEADWNAFRSAQAMVVVLSDVPSFGVPVELGWATSNNTPILAVRFDATQDLPYFNRAVFEYWQIQSIEADERMDQSIDDWLLKTVSGASPKQTALK